MTEIQCTVLVYRDSIIKSLYELQQQNYLCDVEISTTDGTVYVHKVVLAICESSILHKSVSKAGKDSVRGKINCEDYCIEVVESLVRYLYTGEIKVTEKHVHDFSKLCQSFNLKNALDAFVNHMIHQNIIKTTRQLQDGSDFSVSMETCHNLSTLSAAAHTISTIGSFDSSNKIIEQSGLCTSTKEKCSEKRDTVEKKDVKIEDLSDGGYDNEDDDTQDLDLKQYKNVIKSKSSTSQAIIKVDSIEEGFDPRTNKVENFSENSNVGIILTSPESDPHCESPGILKRSKKRTTCTRTASRSKTKTKTKISKKMKNSSFGKRNLKIRIKKNNVPAIENLPEKSKEMKPKRKRGIIHRWCRKCNVRFPEKDLRKHLRQKHPPYCCKMCDWTGLLKRELALHMYSKHQMLIMPDKYPLLQCDHEGCTFKTLFSYALDRHKECHNRLVRHLCDVCGSSFATAGGLREHSLRHADENPIHKCQICDAVFGWKCKLKSHEMKEHGTYLLCEICTYKTKYKDKLIMHLHNEHGQPLPQNQKIHRCDQCDFYCINRTKLRFHKIRHSGEKNYPCPQCGKSFLNQQQMKNHINSTHGARAFSCHICSYASKRKSELSNHIKSRHSDDRPFSCNLCEHACKLKGNLHKHIRLVHKVEVVTRNQLHQNMLETGKGYTQLLNARRKDDITILEKNDGVVSPDKLPRVTETVSTPVTKVDNLQERIFQSNSISHKQLFTESILRRNIELLTRQNEQESSVKNSDTFSTTIASSVLQSLNSGSYQSSSTQNFS